MYAHALCSYHSLYGVFDHNICQVILVVFMFWLCMIVCWPIMKTSFIDMNKPFGLCSMYQYLIILVIMIFVINECQKSKGLVPNNIKSAAATNWTLVNKLNKIWAQKLALEFKIPLHLSQPTIVCRVFSLKLTKERRSKASSVK